MTSDSNTSAKSSFLRNERGATMLEYSLIACCISVLCIAAVSVVGNESRKTFMTVGDKLANGNYPVRVVRE